MLDVRYCNKQYMSTIFQVRLQEIWKYLRGRGRAAFQRFVSTDAKHHVFCVSDTKNV